MTNPTPPTWASDRREAMQTQEAAKVTVLVPGVELRPLVGDHNGARNLFTGLLTLAPKASYPLYTRPFTEVSVLLAGEAAVDVEDRRYRLGPFDAMTVPAGLPRRLVNLSPIRPALDPCFTGRDKSGANLGQRPVHTGRAACRHNRASRG